MHIYTHLLYYINGNYKSFLSYALEIKNLKCVNIKLINLKQCITSKQDRPGSGRACVHAAICRQLVSWQSQ